MSRIDDLIAEHCPDGVQFKALGEVGTFVRGKRFVKTDLVDDGAPCIHYGEIYTKYGTSAYESFTFLRPEAAARLRTASSGDLVIVAAGESVDDVCKAVAWLGDTEVVIHDACFAFKHDLDPMYAAYVFQTEALKAQVRPAVSRSKVVSILAPGLQRIKIPVPPLAVQREVAAILQKMEALQAELQAELQARSQQYAHYRDSLLAFPGSEGVRWAKLGEVLSPEFGTRITKRKDAGTEYPVYGGGGESFRTVDFNREDEYVISRFAMSAECVRRVHGKFWLLDSGFTFSVTDDLVNKDYVAQFLFSRQDKIYSCSSQGAQKNIRIGEFKAIQIPIPPLERQREILNLLEKFEILTGDILVGLPAEIEARRQQYEYYRDRLLTFEEKVA